MNRYLHFVILAIIFIFLFLMFFQASRTTWEGYLFKEEWDLFSTRTGYPSYYYGFDENIWINETQYFSYCQIYYNINSKDGFLVGNDITLNITHGYVEFYTEGHPDVDNITIRIDLEPGDKITEINAIFDGDNKFEFYNLNYNLKIQYVVSGPKDIQAYAIYNDSNLTKPYIANYGNKSYVDIEPAYTTTQLKLAKSVVILSYWVIFLSTVTLMLRFKKPNDESSENRGEDRNMLTIIKKLVPNPLSYFGWGFVGLGTICILIATQFGGDASTIMHSYSYGSFGLAFISIGIAFHSMAHAEESDKKMITIGKSNFMGIDGNLKNITASTIGNLTNIRNRRLTIISWRTGLIQAEKLKDFADDGERDSIVIPFVTIMESLPWNDNRLGENNRIKNIEAIWIIDIYRSVRRVNPNHERRERLQELFYHNIAPLREGENFNQLLDRVQGHLRGQQPNETFQRIV